MVEQQGKHVLKENQENQRAFADCQKESGLEVEHPEVTAKAAFPAFRRGCQIW